MSQPIVPFSLQDAPALIEKLLPVQKLSAEAYKEQMAGSNKTLTALGSYWKGRKPLILNKAVILGSLIPATRDPIRDLEVFESLMAMDDLSFVARSKREIKPKEILAQVPLSRIADYFTLEPEGILPVSSPIDWTDPMFRVVKVTWRGDVSPFNRRLIEAQVLPIIPYRERVDQAMRPEEVGEEVHAHIWDQVNEHLKLDAHSFEELTAQLGIMRFGHRPRVADVFCGSGQIPFEAARLGCDVYASDLNPIAAMLTWGAINIVGGSIENRERLDDNQKEIVTKIRKDIDSLGIETDGNGWRAKVFLYCLEARCPQSGWMVPLLPSLVISKGSRVIVDLMPDAVNKRYGIEVRTNVSADALVKAERGTVVSDARGQEPYMVHTVDGKEFRTKISSLRGDYRKEDGTTGNKLRQWDKNDISPRPKDIYQERLYVIQWARPKAKGKGEEFAFRSITSDDLRREMVVNQYVSEHFSEWQEHGWIPDMRIEPGEKTDEPIRTRGWTYWHHLFNPRQLLILGLIRKHQASLNNYILLKSVNMLSRLCAWETTPARKNRFGKQIGGASNNSKQVFVNQALNTLFNVTAQGESRSEIGLSKTQKPVKLREWTR